MSTATLDDQATDALELEDLDLLDDDVRHAKCMRCHSWFGYLGVPFVAFCGRKAVWLVELDQDPRPKCPACVNNPTCATCGGGRE